MADMEFTVAKRRSNPITFKIGGDNVLLEKAYSKTVVVRDDEGGSREEDQEVAEVRGTSDRTYTFNPPKNAVMLMPILEMGTGDDGMGSAGVDMTKATFDWMGQGLNQEDREHVIARLKDPKDDLDVDALSEIVQGLSARVAGRPTT